jgi:hypothetical protein
MAAACLVMWWWELTARSKVLLGVPCACCVDCFADHDATETTHAVSQHIDAGTLLQLADGSSLRCDVVVGADGANSMVAQHLGLQQPNYAGYVAYRCENTVTVA